MNKNIKYTIEEVGNFLQELGYELVSKEYKNNKQKLVFEDHEGYYYTANLFDLRRKEVPSKFYLTNPYTIQNIKSWLKLNNNDLELISKEYTGMFNKIILKNKCGYFLYTSLRSLLKGNSPNIFYITNPYTIQNIKLWCRLNNKQFLLLSDTYEGSHKYLKWKCLKSDCGEIFEASWDNISHNEGCPFCAGKQVCLCNCLTTKRPELAKEWHPTKNGNLTPYDVTWGSPQSVWWLCSSCGHEWNTSINNRSKTNGTGCPECSESHGEIKIREWLKHNYINYIPQKTYDRLVGLGNGLLSYDFYLPDYNLLIEYQGGQHEKFIKGMHMSKKDFEKQQEHDERKREYAKEHNINLLEIWYYDFDKIEEILNSELNKLDSN